MCFIDIYVTHQLVFYISIVQIFKVISNCLASLLLKAPESVMLFSTESVMLFSTSLMFFCPYYCSNHQVSSSLITKQSFGRFYEFWGITTTIIISLLLYQEKTLLQYLINRKLKQKLIVFNTCMFRSLLQIDFTNFITP